MEKLIGRKILSAKINQSKDIVILETDKGNLYLEWYGDCCAHCYLANVAGADSLVGSTILEAYNADWIASKEGEYDVVESMGTNIKTTKGYVSFESRVEHNGYYSGSLNVKEHPGELYNLSDEQEFKPLEDF